MIYQYVCKFYLNASHYIFINEKAGDTHSHCFELAIDIGTKNKEAFISFTEIESIIEGLLDPYQEHLLNEVAPFDEINPTLENMSSYFETLFRDTLGEKGWVLLTLEVSETPTRAYLINAAENTATLSGLLSADYDKIKEDNKSETETLSKMQKNQVLMQNLSVNATSVLQVDVLKPNLIKVTHDKDDFDYAIPEELMHFDI